MRADDGARAVLFDLVDDPAVHLLLSLHGIIRPDPITHAGQVLDSVRPQLHSHGGDVSLVRIEEGTAFVRLEGACNGCSMSSVTLRNLVEEALVQGVPAISAVEVVAAEPTPTLIPLESLRIGRDPSAEGWAKIGPAAGLAVDDLSTTMVSTAAGERIELIVVNLGQRLSAYRNECAHEGLPLDNAVLDVGNGTLTCPWHGFCFDASSGECLSAPGAQLEALPLRVDDGDVWVRVG
jgi:Fe-S cluster biogenesis protein NfuA/nitrite reductase/ring-hydroxylating ferredoxin subunit